MKVAIFLVCLVPIVLSAQDDDIIQLAKKLGANTLVDLVERAGFTDKLKTGGPFTLFGPTDAAFEKLPKAVLYRLLNNNILLADVLLYHLVSGKVYSSQLTNDMTAPSLLKDGEKDYDIRFNIYKKAGSTLLTAEGSPVAKADQNATNGVIHVVDQVLWHIPTMDIPTELNTEKDVFSTLLEEKVMVDQHARIGVIHVVDQVLWHILTMDIPAELNTEKDVFSTLLEENVMVDQHTTNGVIHAVDQVLWHIPTMDIPFELNTETDFFPTLLEGVHSNPSIETIIMSVNRGAITKADLGATLSGAEPFTLFAPTNDAFAKIPADTLNKLLANKTALTDVLTYHVLSGTVFSSGLSNGEMAKTVEGKSVTISIGSAGVLVNNAKVEEADVAVTNGVIHVIDNVLLPPAFNQPIY